jgi:hypothetical protein
MRVDQIEIHAGTADFQYEPIRPLEVKCEARTNFSKTPTIAEANAKLQELAAGIGATAVVNVKYDSGMSMTSWRSLKATGLAVKKIADEMPCPQCAETIKRAAKVCRFCQADLSSHAADAAVAGSPSSARLASATPPRPGPTRSLAHQEPLRATDNSQAGIIIAVVVVVILGLLGALAS